MSVGDKQVSGHSPAYSVVLVFLEDDEGILVVADRQIQVRFLLL